LDIFSRNPFVMTFLQVMAYRKSMNTGNLRPGNRGVPPREMAIFAHLVIGTALPGLPSSSPTKL